MKHVSKTGKWWKPLLGIILFLAAIGGVLHYLVAYRLRELVKIAVDKESDGVYSFDASKMELSLFRKDVVLKSVHLYCRDSLRAENIYDLRIPELYLSIESWRELLFHQRVTVDSLSILRPVITKYSKPDLSDSAANFRLSSVSSNLKKLLDHLQVRALHLVDGSFSIHRADRPLPLEVRYVNLSIINFSRHSRKGNRLLATDDIDIFIGGQHIDLSDGKHDFAFKQIHFSGRKQQFTIDSAVFHSPATATKGEISLQAERFLFNSPQLSSIYENRELLIDTLYCVRPVLYAETIDKKRKTDSLETANDLIQHFFHNIGFRYIDVVDGELALINRYNPNYTTRKANFRVYNLFIAPGNPPSFTTDSIKLELQDLSFLTTDSLFELKVKKFKLVNDELIFLDATFAPTEMYRSARGFTFEAPLLRLSHISLPELLNKKLKASSALLEHPVINIYNKGGQAGTEKQSQNIVSFTDSDGKTANFYKTLRGLRELIAVKFFYVRDGVVTNTSTSRKAVQLEMQGVDADLLPELFFQSDSLIDIKRSLARLAAKKISAHTNAFDLIMNDYVFYGQRARNRLKNMRLALAKSTTVEGSGLSWGSLDWDLLQNKNNLAAAFFRADSISVVRLQAGAPREAGEKSDLPEIYLGELAVQRFGYREQGQNREISLQATEFVLDSISTYKSWLGWQQCRGLFRNIRVNKNEVPVFTAGELDFSNKRPALFRNVRLQLDNAKGQMNLKIPFASLLFPIASTNLSEIRIGSLELQKPEVEINRYVPAYEGPPVANDRMLVLPAPIYIDRLKVIEGRVRYAKQGQQDTVVAETRWDFDASAIRGYRKGDSIFSYESLHAGFADLAFKKAGVEGRMPSAKLSLQNGAATRVNIDALAIQSDLLFSWKDINLNVKNSDTIGLSIKDLSGQFQQDGFRWQRGMKLAWQGLLGKLQIEKGGISYSTNGAVIDAGNLRWRGKEKIFTINDFSFLPKMSEQAFFDRPGAWQTDYITVSGKQLSIRGLDYSTQGVDSLLHIKKIEADGFGLTASRDKRMPFRHGIEKSMPAQLISRFKIPFRIDSLLVRNSNITVNEIAIKTGQRGTIPIKRLNALITGLNNSGNINDSLSVLANAEVLSYKIDNFYYREASRDTLSYFYAGVNVSPMDLPDLNPATIPLASLQVNKGRGDTLFANWHGNKYAAMGQMNFRYRDLDVELLDAKDTTKRGFLLTAENLAADLIIHKNNRSQSKMFFERDREKFVFNYWVKTVLAGLSTSAGFKSNKKMVKEYKKVKEEYSLPGGFR